VTGECKQDGCTKHKGRAFGYCNAHYSRLSKGRDMTAPIRDVHATDEARFWSKVDKSGECWTWTGAVTMGYGVFRIGEGNRVAHRVSYEWKNGAIPEGAEVDHMCFTRGCVNPDHLRLLSHSLNGQNRASANSNSKSGVRGVYWNEPGGVWIAKAMLNREAHTIGRFTDLAEAEKAVSEWRREHMPYSINDQRKSA
jgi:hypothetical protein